MNGKVLPFKIGLLRNNLQNKWDMNANRIKEDPQVVCKLLKKKKTTQKKVKESNFSEMSDMKTSSFLEWIVIPKGNVSCSVSV